VGLLSLSNLMPSQCTKLRQTDSLRVPYRSLFANYPNDPRYTARSTGNFVT